MGITAFQREICRLIAQIRIDQGESYVAGGVALNTLAHAPRVSRDIDMFHDTTEALDATWISDRDLLGKHGYGIKVVRERVSFVEAIVTKGAERVMMQWVRDSAYRFFPLVRHEDFGLVLHPFDLATNKTLALVGRLEVRDWIDMIQCNDTIQSLGLLAWAACGKDPGYSPGKILEEAARSTHYSAAEIAELAFEGDPPDAARISRQWHQMLKDAETIINLLPPEHLGKCVLTKRGDLFRGVVADLQQALAQDDMLFHQGCVRGALPHIAQKHS